MSKDVIDQIMAENGKDINTQKALTDAETAKLTAANQTIRQLQDTVKAFDGVDVKKLQGDLTALQDKYNTDIGRLKLDNALDRELRANNVRSTKAARALLDLDQIKLDGDRLLGFDDQITALKASDAYLLSLIHISSDFGLNPRNAEDRKRMESIIDGIVSNRTEVRLGQWRGQPNAVLFYIKDADVVLVSKNREFITILKGGVENGRVKNARKLKV